jgi:hypothetical protein
MSTWQPTEPLSVFKYGLFLDLTELWCWYVELWLFEVGETGLTRLVPFKYILFVYTGVDVLK